MKFGWNCRSRFDFLLLLPTWRYKWPYGETRRVLAVSYHLQNARVMCSGSTAREEKLLLERHAMKYHHVIASIVSKSSCLRSIVYIRGVLCRFILYFFSCIQNDVCKKHQAFLDISLKKVGTILNEFVSTNYW